MSKIPIKPRIYIMMKHKRKTSFVPLVFVPIIVAAGLGISLVCFTNIFFHQLNLLVFVCFAFYTFFTTSKIKKSEIKNLAMLDFIDQFIISLSIHKTLLATMQSVEELCDELVKKELASFTQGEALEKIEFLSHFFKHTIYEAFLDIVKTYFEQGGEILQASTALLKEVAETRTKALSIKQLNQQKLAELISGWIFVFLIIIMLRFVVSDIYQQLLLNLSFVYGLQAFIILIIFSFIIYFRIVLTSFTDTVYKVKVTEKYIPVQQFVKTFSLFRMNLIGERNIYKSLEKTANFSEGVISHHLLTLVGELKVSTGLSPFVNFAEKFKEPIVKHIMINVYQMMVEGGDIGTLYEFNYLFDRLYELDSQITFNAVKRKHENLSQMPLLGSGLLVLLIMAGVIGMLGNFLYV